VELSGEGRKAYILYAMLCYADSWCLAASLCCQCISCVLSVGAMLALAKSNERMDSRQMLVRRR
jgi:hypothetical protein